MIGVTERLRVRELDEATDAAFIVELITSPAWLRFIGDRGSDGAAYVRGNRDKENRLFLVELKDTSEPIGLCGLLQRDYLPNRDLGYAVHARFEGQGYASEAARFFLEREKGTVCAIVKPENAKSVALLKRNGFVFVSACKEAEGCDLYQRPA